MNFGFLCLFWTVLNCKVLSIQELTITCTSQTECLDSRQESIMPEYKQLER